MYDRTSRYQTDRQARKDATTAASFRPNPELERALQLRDQHPAEFAALSPTVKTSLGYYLTSKAAAARAATNGDLA